VTLRMVDAKRRVCECVDCICPDQDGICWWALVNAVIKQRF
jgi:hypothetical protein